MSLLLCRQESVKQPYFVEFLGIHLHSSQELSYVIYHNPFLVLDEFINEELLTFLREDLNQGFLALKIERWIKSGEAADEALLMILQEGDYYDLAEISRYRQQLAALRKLSPVQLEKEKADRLFLLRHYGKALSGYEALLEMPKDAATEESFYGKVWNNMGSCYGRMFQLEQAFSAYEKAYSILEDPEILQRLYQLTRLDSRLALGQELEGLVTPELKEQWENHLKTVREQAVASQEALEVEELFTRDQVKRQAGAAGLLTQWKKEYRSMVS